MRRTATLLALLLTVLSPPLGYAVAPVTVLDKEQLQASGLTSIGDILQRLPEQSNATNTQVNIGGSGAARVNLRGLGPERTLVLVNGRRHVAGGTGADGSVDLNAIPLAAVERIEILKNGGSVLYGSDAIAGVVNIITRRELTGVEARLFSGISSRGDGLLYGLSLTTGHSTEQNSILFTASYDTQKDVSASQREFSKYDTLYDFNERRSSPQGSRSIPEGHIVSGSSDSGGSQLWLELKSKHPRATSFMRDSSTGEWRPFSSVGVTDHGGDLYNYQPESYLITPRERAHVSATAGLQFAKASRGFLEVSYTHRQSAQQLAAEPLLTRLEGVTVSASNVYNPFGRNFTDVQRRLVEFGNRRNTQALSTFRIVAGLEGTLPDDFGPLHGFTWDLAFTYGHTRGLETQHGLLRRGRLHTALGPSFMDPDTGEARCGTPVEPIAECVPLNLFGGPGSISPEMVKHLSPRGIAHGLNQQQSISANMGGELFKLSPSTSAAGIALGYEHRQETGAINIVDPLEVEDDTTIYTGPPAESRFKVNEAYVELSLPVLGTVDAQTGEQRDMLEFTGAARVARYNTVGMGLTYQLGTRVSLLRDLAARAMYSTAFRGPSVATLIGSEELKQSETAKLLTVGMVFEPRFFKGLTAAVDYFDIGVAQQSSIRTAGVDFNFRYQPRTWLGRVGFNLDATWLQRLDWSLDDGQRASFKGIYDLGVNTDWKTNLGLSWARGALSTSANVRFINGFRECENNGCAAQQEEGAEPLSRPVRDYYALDANVAYAWETKLGTATTQLGVNNVLDASPPYVANGFGVDSNPTAYDFMGRYFYARLSYSYE